MLDWMRVECVRARQKDLQREAEQERLALAAREAKQAVGCDGRRRSFRGMLGLSGWTQKELAGAEPN